MIKNDEQFRVLFYLYVLGDYDNLEKFLKDYLLYHGYNHVRDLDLLLIYYNEKGEI